MGLGYLLQRGDQGTEHPRYHLLLLGGRVSQLSSRQDLKEDI